MLFGAGMVLASSQPAPEADAALLLQLPETNAPPQGADALPLARCLCRAPRLEVRSHQVAKPPAMRITAVAPWMPGLEVGHELPWFGKEGDRFTQRSLPADGLPDGARVLAVSTLDQGPILLEEELPDGRRLVALDLESPNGKAGYDPGSKLKWFFIARALDSKAFYGRHVPRRLTVEEYTQQLRDLADQRRARDARGDRQGSAGDPIFGSRWARGRAALRLHRRPPRRRGDERLRSPAPGRGALENPAKDARISRLLEEYSVEIIPLLNAWGYAHRKQTNSRDCDLNRNFDYLWEEFTGDGGWRAAIKPEVLRGAAPFSEGESQAVRDRLLAGKVAGYIDFHQHGREHGHMLMLPHRPVQRQPEALVPARVLNAHLAAASSERQAAAARSQWQGTPRPFAKLGGLADHRVHRATWSFEESLTLPTWWSGSLHFMDLTAHRRVRNRAGDPRAGERTSAFQVSSGPSHMVRGRPRAARPASPASSGKSGRGLH